MDPVSVILTALTAGAAVAAKDTASTAVKDAYEGLKALIRRRFEGKPAAEAALAEHEKDPKTWEKPLQKAVAESAADDEVVQTAQRVLQLVQPQQVAEGKFAVQIGQAQGVVIGDEAKVTQRFGDKP